MSIKLTESAAERVREQLASREGCLGLKLGVKNSGCSGFAYVIDFTESSGDDDHVFESRGIKVVVRDEHLPLLSGTEIDYVQNGLSSVFHFHNPNVTEECGCGESFTVN
jgi:iron-sulfur cluster assembly protein